MQISDQKVVQGVQHQKNGNGCAQGYTVIKPGAFSHFGEMDTYVSRGECCTSSFCVQD